MFIPSFATVSGLLDGDTVARKSGVQVGDFIVAVNGEGFRRFAPDFSNDELENLTNKDDDLQNNNNAPFSDDKVLHLKKGEAYAALLQKIKEIKQDNSTAGSSTPPLELALERHAWDARAHSWPRFLTARDNDVPQAMMMLQNHEEWKERTFPIDLTSIQEVLKLKAVSEIDISTIPTVYVNYAKLQQLEGEPVEVVKAFVIFTELMLAKAPDPRSPKTCQFIDLSGVSISAGFRVDVLKLIYQTFEPNYPETLHKMVMYPVSKTVVCTI
jgi:CRAL/TRIO domain